MIKVALLLVVASSAVSMQLLYGAQTNQPLNDVRILIDLSGSMKKNDPENLRKPALKLLVNLLPKGSRAGVWTFAKQVNMLVPLKNIDKKWRAQAIQSADLIHSLGLYTNIEEVLKQASVGWGSTDDNYRRSLILLTDGKVDIAKDTKVNQRSRQQILHKLLPQFKQANAALYTIALSSNTDEQLLTQLANGSGGWHVTVSTEDDLQKAFFKVFEQATQPETLPLEKNQFVVDESIEEMTLLVFRNSASAAMTVMSPNGQVIDHSSKSTPSAKDIRWFSQNDYDLVTISKPQTGKWQVQADLDPNNRVMVITHLHLSRTELPNNLFKGEKISLEAHLDQQGEIISNPDLLNLISFTAKLGAIDNIHEQPLLDDGQNADLIADDFLYSIDLTEHLKLGEQEIIVLATSATFHRERRQQIKVHQSPIEEQIERQENGGYLVSIAPRTDLVDKQNTTIEISVSLISDAGEALLESHDKASGSLALPPLADNNSYRLNILVKGKMLDGRNFSVTLPPSFIKPADDEKPLAGEKPLAESEGKPTQWQVWFFSIAIPIVMLLAIFLFILWRKKFAKAALDQLNAKLEQS